MAQNFHHCERRMVALTRELRRTRQISASDLLYITLLVQFVCDKSGKTFQKQYAGFVCIFLLLNKSRFLVKSIQL